MIKLNEDKLKTIIAKVLKESVFGLSGRDLEDMGLKNPADDYVVDKNELAQKTNEFLSALKNFNAYLAGVEEDAENGIKAKDGVYQTMRSRAMWNDDSDEEYISNLLRDVSFSLSHIENLLGDVIDYC